MANYNKVLLMGNLTRDVELKSVGGGTQVANIGLAVNRRWTAQDGQQKEETTFVDCEAWGRTAETMAKYLSKGRPVFIEGRLKLDQWEKEGQKFSKLRVVVESFQFVDSRQGGGGGGGGGGGEDVQSGRGGGWSAKPAPREAPASAGGSGGGSGGGQAPPDDIPF